MAGLQDIIVRPAQPDDLAGVEALISPFVDARKILPRTTDELADLLRHGFVAVADEAIVGFGTLEIYSRKLAEIRSLCVSTEFQGRGIGKRITRACIDLAKERNIFEVMVITSSEEIFRSCGFEFTLPGEKKALFLQTRDEP
ncbi:MAG: GNAT family N-acetyltransferase [Planctomycetaceae bacterium]|nr:GNAT family N-acetyltransferase [Planctomycetaceae bacterium]